MFYVYLQRVNNSFKNKYHATTPIDLHKDRHY